MTRTPPLSSHPASTRKRAQRERLRAAGLSAVELWIPKHARHAARRFEELARSGRTPFFPTPSKETPATMDLNLLASSLQGYKTDDGASIADVRRADNGDAANTLVIQLAGREAIPIVLCVEDDQITCFVHLFDADAVHPDKRADLADSMLELNPSLPLSSFGKTSDGYILFGAIAANADIPSIVHELVTLSDNTAIAIQHCQDALIRDPA